MPAAEERIQEVRRTMVLAALAADHLPRDIAATLDISVQAVNNIRNGK